MSSVDFAIPDFYSLIPNVAAATRPNHISLVASSSGQIGREGGVV
jgi:hypothetical protein